MNILLNDKQQSVDDATTLATLIKQHGSDGQAFAVAVNDAFVPRSNYENTALNEGDRVELLVPMQGG